METPRVSIIIVSWNVVDALRRNLAALHIERDRGVSCEVIVVDNGSRDGSAKMVREEFPWVHVIHNDYNSGFAHACNQGILHAKGEVVLLLNPDNVVSEGAINKTADVLTADMSLGVVGAHLVGEDGATVRSVRRDPGIWDQLALFLKLPHLFPSMLDGYLRKDFDYSLSQDVDQIRGSYFAFRRELVRAVGYFDERFFLWFEEVDYCRRVRALGFRVRYLADVTCIDCVGRSFAQVSLWKKQWMFFSSMAKYFMKWGVRNG